MVSLGENISTVLQRKVLPKCKGSHCFSIPCIVGIIRFGRAILD